MAKKKSKAKSGMKARPAAKAKRPAARPKPKASRKPAVRAKAKTAARKPAAAKAAPPQPARSKVVAPGSQWVNPHLVVRDMKASIEFYTNAFGFTLRAAMPGPDGSLMHAELMHNDSLVMLGPASAQMGAFAPEGPSPVTLYVYVENVDAVTARAESLGGKVVRPVADQFWGDRCSVVVDPEGHSWMLATHLRAMTPEEMMQEMNKLFGA